MLHALDLILGRDNFCLDCNLRELKVIAFWMVRVYLLIETVKCIGLKAVNCNTMRPLIRVDSMLLKMKSECQARDNPR